MVVGIKVTGFDITSGPFSAQQHKSCQLQAASPRSPESFWARTRANRRSDIVLLVEAGNDKEECRISAHSEDSVCDLSRTDVSPPKSGRSRRQPCAQLCDQKLCCVRSSFEFIYAQAKIADHAQTLHGIGSMPCERRTIDQALNTFVHIETLRELGAIALSQINGTIHQSMKLKIDHALDQLVDRRRERCTWQCHEVVRSSLLGHEIPAKQEIKRSELPNLGRWPFFHDVRLRPRPSRARRDIARTRASVGRDIEYQEPVLGKHFANLHEGSSQIAWRTPKVALRGHAEYVRACQIIAGAANDLGLAAFAVELDVVGRWNFPGRKQRVPAANTDSTRAERDCSLAACIHAGAVKGAFIGVRGNSELALPVLISQRYSPV